MIRCIIVEDEELAQEVIRRHLERISSFELVGVYRTASEAREALKQSEVDLMFLDIRLPGMSGLSFLSTLPDPPLVILTTAYAEYALESYEFNVIDYLLKPISFDRFSKALQKVDAGRLLSRLPDTPGEDFMFVKSGGKFFRVNFAEVIYIQGMRDYLKIVAEGYTVVTLQTMGDMEKQLPSGRFIRVHRSYIVSISRIRSIYGNSVTLAKGEIPIGLVYKEAVMKLVSSPGSRPSS
ncbi:LytR/AlgR family response regulator transcription factor [Dinghuibacter silviterrae]|uniref:LytTR family two component transcriptional regulator n=1 Tax=Dinghuibacter silviterrae TaxID=1539049 RepID=A0A4R8DGU5_9BACT|nr:LytTR family DNA-binding domain-containing protein [Dinghuibacter silviterrae]TDW96608.1 LytTR family two component transcriptional regulator [Dinghuibacter silviterrae]